MPIDLKAVRKLSEIKDNAAKCDLPTDTRYRLSLIPDLVTKKVPLADDQNSEYCATEQRNSNNFQKRLDPAVDLSHLPNSRTIRALNCLVNLFSSIFIAES